MRYRADITAGALKLPESRVVADLLIRGVDGQEWHAAISERNVHQARSTETARRLARLIRSRLARMDGELGRLVRDGAGDTATYAVLAAAVKHSRLLGGRGLGNEIAFYIFDYPPQQELRVRDHVRFLLEHIPRP